MNEPIHNSVWMIQAEGVPALTIKDDDLFLASGLHLRLIANELRRMDILKTADSHEALHTIGKVLEQIIVRPIEDYTPRVPAGGNS